VGHIIPRSTGNFQFDVRCIMFRIQILRLSLALRSSFSLPWFSRVFPFFLLDAK
jgi:hypothetical protein